jgi:hypothetical protein
MYPVLRELFDEIIKGGGGTQQAHAKTKLRNKNKL